MHYDVIIIGAGPGGIFTAYEMLQQKKEIKIAVFEAVQALSLTESTISPMILAELCMNISARQRQSS